MKGAPQSSHYEKVKPEPILIIEGWKLNFHLGNVLKYIARWNHKDGLKDLKKAYWYLGRYIKMVEGGKL